MEFRWTKKVAISGSVCFFLITQKNTTTMVGRRVEEEECSFLYAAFRLFARWQKSIRRRRNILENEHEKLVWLFVGDKFSSILIKLI